MEGLHETQGYDTEYGQEEGPFDSSGNAGKIHLDRFISLIPVPYYMGWFLLAAAYFLVSITFLVQFEESLSYIGAFFIISIIIALEGTAIGWAHIRMKSFENILIKIVDLPREEIIKLSKRQEAEIFNDKRMALFAIIFIGFVHISGIDYHATSFYFAGSSLLFNLGYYFAVYLEGAGLLALVMTALTVHKIGKLPMRVNTLYSDFHAIGILYSKFTIFAATVYVIWGIFHMIVPPIFSSLQVILWFLGFAALLFAYFILPQYSIHKMMASTKKGKIDLFSSQIKAALDESFGVPTKENVAYLRDMLSVQNQLNQMCEWPFGAKELLYIALIIVIPLFVILLEITLGIIR